MRLKQTNTAQLTKKESFSFLKSKKESIFASAKTIGVWRSWLAYLHGVQVVVRSSRITPTQ